MDELNDFLCVYEQAVVSVAKGAKPTTAAEAKWRCWTVPGFDTDMTDSLTSLAVLAAQTVQDVQKAGK